MKINIVVNIKLDLFPIAIIIGDNINHVTGIRGIDVVSSSWTTQYEECKC